MARSSIAFAAMALLAALASADAQAPAPAERVPPRPAYQCPATPYLNCMPPIGADRRDACAKDYLAWVQKNCPKTQIVY